MDGWKVTIDINGFPMDFGPKPLLAMVFQWFWSPKPLVAMVFQWFPMVANHLSDDGMVTIHRSGLARCKMQVMKPGRGKYFANGHTGRRVEVTVFLLVYQMCKY